MKPQTRNIVAIVVGLVVGMVVNMGLISISDMVIPLPEGVDPMDPESLKENMHLFEKKHFIMPFLAHALGTLAGAFTLSKLAVSRHLSLSMILAVVFLAGGIAMVFDVPSPTWFNAVDLIGAYFPMAFLGNKLAGVKAG